MKQPDIEIVALDDKRRNQLLTHWRSMPDQQATFAMDLVKLMAMTTDPSIKRKNALVTPSQIVERAVEITEMMFSKFEQKGWIIDFPSFADMEAHQSAQSAPPGFK